MSRSSPRSPAPPPGRAALRPDVRRAMLDAAHAALDEGGIPALGLRAIARRAGVSATAGDPYFGNHAGLLAALAAEGFEALAGVLAQAGDDRAAMGEAYLRFALNRPQMFNLMFRSDGPDWSAPILVDAAGRALGLLGGRMTRGDGDTRAAALRATAAWGAVHGLAALAVDGRLERLRAQAGATDIAVLVTQALGALRLA